MIISKELTAERIEEIKNFPIVCDEDSPELTREQILNMKPKYPERFAKYKQRIMELQKDHPELTLMELFNMEAEEHPEHWHVEPVKVALSIKIDADILAWFKEAGKGYQTRINAALRETMRRAQEQVHPGQVYQQ